MRVSIGACHSSSRSVMTAAFPGRSHADTSSRKSSLIPARVKSNAAPTNVRGIVRDEMVPVSAGVIIGVGVAIGARPGSIR